MKSIDFKTVKVDASTILFASTSDPDYEMNRIMLVENGYCNYIIVEGGHCSCYGFDETEWDAIEYTEDAVIIGNIGPERLIIQIGMYSNKQTRAIK